MIETYFISGFFLLLIILAITYRIFETKIKGKKGEFSISSRLLLLDKKKYTVLNNLILSYGNYTSQIDHLIVSDFGIFVIETKNYKGWILGAEKSEYWTQVLFKKKYKLYNPIHQNKSHILTLKNILKEYNDIRYIPIVVFTSKASIRVSTSNHVINSYDLIRTIKRYSGIYISENEKIEIIEKLNSSSNKSKTIKSLQIKSI